MSNTFTMYRGDTVSLLASVVANGAVYDITGAAIYFTAKWNYTDEDGSAVFQKSIGSGISVTSAVNGRFTVTISPTDTSSLPNGKHQLLWDCQMVTSQGSIYTLASGYLVVYPDVTLRTS